MVKKREDKLEEGAIKIRERGALSQDTFL